MTPIHTNRCNFTYTAPAGMTAEQCGDLPCYRNPDTPLVTSWWQPTPEERSHLICGGLIVFQSYSLQHPPVSITTCLTTEQSENPPAADPFIGHAAQAAINTLIFDNERLRDKHAEAANEATRLSLQITLIKQDFDTIRSIITKGGTTADVLKFLDTPNA